jgi:hypothetical protein
MASSTYGQYAVKGVNLPFVTYRTDNRAGRIDFQIRNYGTNAVKVRVQESELDGTYPANLVADTLIQPGGGVVDVSINSAKGQIQLLSGSGNTANSNVYIQASFFGISFYGGNISDMEGLDRSGFYTGTEIPRGVRD